MLTQLIFDSFLFWAFLSVIVLTAIWIGRAAIRIFEYEKQVDRGWNDLISRAEEMIKEIKQLSDELRENKPTKNKVIKK